MRNSPLLSALGKMIDRSIRRKNLYQTVTQADGRLHHGQIWIRKVRIMRTRFQQGLDDLRQKLLRMGGLAEQAVDRARQALH